MWSPAAFRTYHLFLHLKKFLGGKRFDDDDDLKDAVQKWLTSQAAAFYEEGIQKLVPRYDKCLINCGEYVKKYLKNVESDNNKILYEKVLDFFYSETVLTIWISLVVSLLRHTRFDVFHAITRALNVSVFYSVTILCACYCPCQTVQLRGPVVLTCIYLNCSSCCTSTVLTAMLLRGKKLFIRRIIRSTRIHRLERIIFNVEGCGTYAITAGLHGVKQYKETNFHSFRLHVSNNLFSTKSTTQVTKNTVGHLYWKMLLLRSIRIRKICSYKELLSNSE